MNKTMLTYLLIALLGVVIIVAIYYSLRIRAGEQSQVTTSQSTQNKPTTEEEAGATARYGVAVPYQENVSIVYPNFTITYLGERTKYDDFLKRDTSWQEFSVTHDGVTQSVIWSSGLGDIGPSSFTIGTREYYLELRSSVFTEGNDWDWLGDNELVISPAAMYDAQKSKYYSR